MPSTRGRRLNEREPPRWVAHVVSVYGVQWTVPRFRSGGLPLAVEVEAIQFHHFRPGGNEVLHELLLRIVTGIDLGEGS
jgi:hypothetical protein